MVETDPPRTGEEEPEEAERVERLVQLDEVVEPTHLLELHRQRGHQHVDEERNADGPGEEAQHDEEPTEEFGPAGESCVEGWRGDAPLDEALGEGVEVVDLPPSGLEEEIADEEAHQQLRHPLRVGQAAQRIVDPCGETHVASAARTQPSANQLEMARKAASTASARSAKASQTAPSGLPDRASVSACASSSSIGACSTSNPFLQTATVSRHGEGRPGGRSFSRASHKGANSCASASTRNAGTKRKRSRGISAAPIARNCSGGAGSRLASSNTLARA